MSDVPKIKWVDMMRDARNSASRNRNRTRQINNDQVEQDYVYDVPVKLESQAFIRVRASSKKKAISDAKIALSKCKNALVVLHKKTTTQVTVSTLGVKYHHASMQDNETLSLEDFLDAQ